MSMMIYQTKTTLLSYHTKARDMVFFTRTHFHVTKATGLNGLICQISAYTKFSTPV